MFGINRRSDNDKILTLQLNGKESGKKERTTIIRNRNPRRRAGMNLYHRADQFLMRLKVSEGFHPGR